MPKPKTSKASDECTEFETVELKETMNPSYTQESESEMDSDVEKKSIEKSFQSVNRKGKKSGGFQSMGMNYTLR